MFKSLLSERIGSIIEAKLIIERSGNRKRTNVTGFWLAPTVTGLP
ncbi:hypothetical protein MNBD_ALPHA11-2012 [hydrothermal vent metagenome]|uniref:Uncharacterized protein n=1 Tax=hydrothermal vent metagenome TaxID=652676 RepID=A0A3B0TRN8_9ZZZZ